MRALDLDAEIVPGKSAAGFDLGMDVSEIENLVGEATVADPIRNIVQINANSGVLVVRSPEGHTKAVYFGSDHVRLVFNELGKLFCIYTFEGYRGMYRGRIKIGSPLSTAENEHPLEFDDADEMSYVEGVPGIAFCGTSCSLQKDQEQVISGFCVHDWSQK